MMVYCRGTGKTTSLIIETRGSTTLLFSGIHSHTHGSYCSHIVLHWNGILSMSTCNYKLMYVMKRWSYYPSHFLPLIPHRIPGQTYPPIAQIQLAMVDVVGIMSLLSVGRKWRIFSMLLLLSPSHLSSSPLLADDPLTFPLHLTPLHHSHHRYQSNQFNNHHIKKPNKTNTHHNTSTTTITTAITATLTKEPTPPTTLSMSDINSTTTPTPFPFTTPFDPVSLIKSLANCRYGVIIISSSNGQDYLD